MNKKIDSDFLKISEKKFDPSVNAEDRLGFEEKYLEKVKDKTIIDSDELPPLFENKEPMSKASFFNLCLYSWVSPVVSYANKYGKIRLSGLGNIHEGLKCDQEATRI